MFLRNNFESLGCGIEIFSNFAHNFGCVIDEGNQVVNLKCD